MKKIKLNNEATAGLPFEGCKLISSFNQSSFRNVKRILLYKNDLELNKTITKERAAKVKYNFIQSRTFRKVFSQAWLISNK